MVGSAEIAVETRAGIDWLEINSIDVHQSHGVGIAGAEYRL